MQVRDPKHFFEGLGRRMLTSHRLANLVLPPPGIKYKASTMPFTQRENISQFLTACERQPLLLPAHDRFLTVDLYDHKDPAQVIQCIGAFSRAAKSAKPFVIRTALGPKRAGAASPTRKTLNGDSDLSGRHRGSSITSQGNEAGTAGRRAMSPALTGESNMSSSTRISNPSVTSWSTRTSEYSSAPAWNIHQYGYMGGASQGNQGISFGARRQITTPQVWVPSVAEKERKRKEQDLEAERQRREQEQVEKDRRQQREEEERQARRQEQEQWEDETRNARENERRQLDLDRQRWEVEERRWQEEDAQRKKEQDQADKEMNGAFLSQAEQKARDGTKAKAENDRILELEHQLGEAKERERRYQVERNERSRQVMRTPDTREPTYAHWRPAAVSTPTKDSDRDSWAPDERVQLRQAWNDDQTSAGSSTTQAPSTSRPLPNLDTISSLQATPQNMRSSKPQSDSHTEAQSIPPPSAAAEASIPAPLTFSRSTSSSNNTRPLPDPSAAKATYNTSKSSPFNASRTDRYLASNPAPNTPPPRTNFPHEMGMTSESERAGEDARRQQSQQKTKAGGRASNSLLEREMERERERQKEWEEQQMAKRPASGLMGPRDLRR